MMQMISITALFGALGLFGLLIAATSQAASTQYMGLGLLGLAWFLMIRYHGRRLESAARRSATRS